MTLASSQSSQTQTMREALRDAMAEEMRRDGNVFVIGEEIGDYGGTFKVTQGLLAEFGPSRVVDTPTVQQGFAGLAIGAASTGLRPVVEFMTFNYALQAVDLILHSAAKSLYMSDGRLACPVVFRGPNGSAPRVGAQHAHDVTSLFAHVPGLKVVAPSNAADAKGLLKSAIRDPGPVIFLENEMLYGTSADMPDGIDHLVPLGSASIVRAGIDVSLIAWSTGVPLALQAAKQLAQNSISAEVIDLRSLRPLDTATILASVRKTGRCVSVGDGWPQCGIGAEISALVMEQAFGALKAPVQRISAKDVPMPYAASLERLALPSVADIVAAAQKTFS